MEHLSIAPAEEPGGRGSPSEAESACQKKEASSSAAPCVTTKPMLISMGQPICITPSIGSGTGSRGSLGAADQSGTPCPATGRAGEARQRDTPPKTDRPGPQADEPARKVVGLALVCAIEARHRLLQKCNPLVSKWLKQRLTLRRKAAGNRSMSSGRPDGLST